MLREQQQELQMLREQQQELQQQERERELPLSYRKQPGQRQRSELPKREFCSFLNQKVS